MESDYRSPPTVCDGNAIEMRLLALLSSLSTRDIFPQSSDPATSHEGTPCAPSISNVASQDNPLTAATFPRTQTEIRAETRARYLRRFQQATETGDTTEKGPTAGAPQYAVDIERRAKLRAGFVQVVKETALCFLALQGQAKVCGGVAREASASGTARGSTSFSTGAASSPSSTKAAASLASARLARQGAVVNFTKELILTAAREELNMQQAVTRLREAAMTLVSPHVQPEMASKTGSPVFGDEEKMIIVNLPHVPLYRWSGWGHYANFMTRVDTTKAMTRSEDPITTEANSKSGENQLRKTVTQSRKAEELSLTCECRFTGPASAPLPTTASLGPPNPKRCPAFDPNGTTQCALPSTDGVKYFMSRDDLVHELATYWRLHEEAAARARLHALRHKDTEAFAEHVSLLKISTLLGIMEKTHDFMVRIGLKLKHKAAAGDATTIADSKQGGVVALSSTGVSPTKGASSEYQRFKAYVSSTKDEFRLVHQVDVFVEKQPNGLHATLLPHQMDGLRFLMSLHANGINGILADEMGVGKTIQTLAFLLLLKEQRMALPLSCVEATQQRPHLVLAPLSVVREWREACEQFVPHSLRVTTFDDLENPVCDALLYDLVLMPIHAARAPRVQAAAAQIPWGYLVVDEAHKAVANLHTQTAVAILSFPYQRRLVLTGTPLNSDLQELWSLLYFLNPEVFTDGDSFDEIFRRPFATYDAAEMELSSEERGLLVLRLHQILRPFMLRRTKRDIDSTLKMTFHTLRCPVTTMQARLLALLREARRTPATAAASSSTDSDTEADESQRGSRAPQEAKQEGSADPVARDAVLALSPHKARRYHLTSADVSESTAQLLCNHAFLLPFFSRVLAEHNLIETLPETIREEGLGSQEEAYSLRGAADMVLACSGKFLVLHLFLSRLFLARRKAVIFTHWLDCVDLLSESLLARGWENHYEVLTGATSEEERKVRVRRFREDPECLFFLLSVKAGGCGINLQNAHVVIMLDRDYTSTNEDQALARVYRIGQINTVRAVYLTTNDPAEQRVAERAERKNKPRKAIIEDGNYQVGGDADTNTQGGEQDDRDMSEVMGSDLEECDGANAGDATTEECTDASGARDDAPVIPAGAGTVHDGMEALWEVTPSATPEEVTAETSVARPTAEQLYLLQSMVSTLDNLVLTDADVKEKEATGDVPSLASLTTYDILAASRKALQSETSASPCDNNVFAPAWSHFWKVWSLAKYGPPMLRDALDAAVENDRKLHDPEEQRRRREKRATRQESLFTRLLGNAPPHAWFMECWERGVEDDEEIARLYEAHIAEKRRQAAQKQAMQEERQTKRVAKRQARDQAQAERAARREAKKLAKKEPTKRKKKKAAATAPSPPNMMAEGTPEASPLTELLKGETMREPATPPLPSIASVQVSPSTPSPSTAAQSLLPFSSTEGPPQGGEAAATTTDQSAAVIAADVRRPRGRPRKNPVTTHPSNSPSPSSPTVSVASESAEKRKRGRPRTRQHSADDLTGATESPMRILGEVRGRRPVGRPRKYPKPDAPPPAPSALFLSDDPLSSVHKRKRGRPPKHLQAVLAALRGEQQPVPAPSVPSTERLARPEDLSGHDDSVESSAGHPIGGTHEDAMSPVSAAKRDGFITEPHAEEKRLGDASSYAEPLSPDARQPTMDVDALEKGARGVNLREAQREVSSTPAARQLPASSHTDVDLPEHSENSQTAAGL